MEPTRYYPMNSAELLDSVLDVYKKSFGKQIAISIIFNIIMTITIYIFVFIGIMALAISLAGNAFSESSLSGAIPMIILLIFFIVLIAVIFGALTTTGNALITKHTFLGEECSVGGVLKESFKKIIPASLAGLGNTLVMVPVFALLALFIYLYFNMIIGFIRYGSSPATLTIVATVAVVILILLVSVICSALTMMSLSVAIFEKKYFMAAVYKSFQLARRDFAKILGLVAVWTLITSATSYSLTSIFDLVRMFGDSFLPQEASGMLALASVGIGSIFSMVVSTLLSPLSGIFSTMMYMNQRFKHEGLDIELNLNQVTARRREKEYMERMKNMPPPPYGYR